MPFQDEVIESRRGFVRGKRIEGEGSDSILALEYRYTWWVDVGVCSGSAGCESG